MKKRKIKLPSTVFEASFRAETFNEDDRTVDLVWTTGAKVRRSSFFDGEFFEELSLKRDHVNLDRLNKGAPLLNNHRSSSLEDNIGVVRKAWIRGGEGIATVQLSGREDVAGIVQDVRDGIIKNVSVGYRVEQFEDVTKKKDEIPTFRAVKWTPMELSLVNINADEDSQVRSAAVANQEYESEVYSKENDMRTKEERAAIEKLVKDLGLDESVAKRMIESESTLTELQAEAIGLVAEARATIVEPEATPVVEPVVEPVVDTDAVRAEAADAEKQRHADISSLVESVGLERSVADGFIKDNTSVEDARKEVIKTLAERNAKQSTNSVTVEVSVEQQTKRRAACVRALAHRHDNKNKMESGDNAFIGGSLMDTAREFLASEGINTRGLFGSELCKRALHSSSDFALVLEDLSNKSLRAAYDEAPQTFMPFTRERSVRDFKQISNVQLGEGSGLEKVNEHGEYKKTTLSESAEKYSIDKYGKILGLTWELMLNDDLDAFSRIPAILGRKVRDKESELIWAIITGNPLMADGVALFDAAHGNLAGAGAPPSVTTLGASRSRMRLQTGLDGEILNLTPRYLVVPTALETLADQLTAQLTAQDADKVNPFSNRLVPIVEPRLDADSAVKWYLAADKGSIDMIELARLDGRGPEIFTREGFEVDGMQTKIRYVFGVKAIDFRGFDQNPGA